MTDRVIVYDGALPQVTDILNTNKFGLVGQAFQNQALLGSSTVVAGLACAPTVPASLQVTVGTGSIYQLDPTDASAYGDLGIDNNVIVKQGILHSAVNLTITPPGTVGFSQVYLVEAILSDIDAGQTVLSYFNSTPPNVPFAGPANSGISQFTTRTGVCTIALKAGVPATTGTQVAPTTDVGFVGLYTITVVNGQTQITAGNIVQLPSAPFFPTLPAVPAGVQGGNWVYVGTDTGTANNYVISFGANQPIPTAYVPGMGIKFKAANACTGASVINVNGLGNVSIRRSTGVALSGTVPDISSGQIVELTYDGTNFQMQNYLGSAATSNTNTVVGIPYITDTGAQNALIATFSPAITSGQQIAGLTVEVKLANTITGACTINVNGLGLKNVTTGDLQSPPNGVYVAGEVLLLVYDGTQYQIANTSSLTYRKPSANLTIFVNQAIGNDANDGVSNLSGHALATIGAGMKLAFSYAPSQFTITIQVAAGTYNEAVATPFFAGPNVIVNGASSASVTVSSGAASCFLCQGPNTLTVQTLTVQNSTGIGTFQAIDGATLNTSGTVSNACGYVFSAASGGTVNPGNHTFSGSVTALYFAQQGASIVLGGSGAVTHTISTSISVSIASASAQSAFIIVISGNLTFVNPTFVSGIKFSAILNGVVNSEGNGVNFFPGNVAGTTATGGQYA